MFPYETKLYAAPSEEPIDIGFIRSWCRVDVPDDDQKLLSLIKGARIRYENESGRALVTQSHDVYWQCFGHCLTLPWGSLQSVDVFEWQPASGALQSWTVSGSDLLDGSTVMAHVDTASEPGRIRLASGKYWPTATLKTVNPIHARITVGYGAAAAVPEDIKLAIAALAYHLYYNPGGDKPEPPTFRSVVESYRLHWY